MPDLCQLADEKAWLKIPPTQTSEDALLSRLISAVSADFLQAIDRADLTPTANYTDVHQLQRKSLRAPSQSGEVWSGRGNLRIGLRHWPINSIASVTVDGNAVAVSVDGVADGYFYDAAEDPEYRNTLQLIDISFQFWSSVLSVTYNAGYATVPKDIEQAVIEWVAFRYRSRDWIGQTNKHMNTGESVSFQTADAPATTKAVIDRYLRRPPIL